MFKKELNIIKNGDMTDLIIISVLNTLDSDGRIYVPIPEITGISFDIPMDIQIRKNDGTTVMIHRKLNGEFSMGDVDVDGIPVMQGTVTSI